MVSEISMIDDMKKTRTGNKKENETTGEIVSCLIKKNIVTDKHVKHALRIKSKLASKVTLLDILVDLGYLSETQIKETLRQENLSIRVGDLLIELGYITKEKLDAALQIQKQTKEKKKLGEILIEHKFLSESSFLELLSVQMGFPHIEPDIIEIDRELASKTPVKWCRTNQFIPVKMENGSPLIVFVDPLNKSSINAAKKIFGADIIIGVASQSSMKTALNRLEISLTKKSAVVDQNSAQGIVDSIIQKAIVEDVSDIHIEPLKDKLQVRFRQDGVLAHYKDFPGSIIPMVTSRLKIMSNLNITEKRRHQGGRIAFEYNGSEFALRISFYITIHGEKIVMRVLNKMNQVIDIDHIGMQPRILKRFLKDAVSVPSGVLIVTGPTGSGKTTTLYSCIDHIKCPEVSIITAEDPVEYIMDDIAQCSINPEIDLTFEETLKHVVRQDPDVIIIGEIRDSYSAEVAIQASMTGHKVFTSFHTEDSVSGLIRLMNMEIEPSLIASTVVCVLGQRLLRKVCGVCGKPYKPSPEELAKMGYTPAETSRYQFLKGAGCPSCSHTGYKGRIAVFEMLILNEFIKDAILNNKPSYEIRKISIETAGLVTLFEDAVYKAAAGITTVDEIFRCVPKLLPPRPIKEIRRLQGV
ncbi:MAG: ATPase, T2SS/T4P/T4SS family [Thermodesulfobacteriota bacterium]|nr:ATPase, T2SS/T4P/T4SS family [Thermodesulfobacteriota bacterium]